MLHYMIASKVIEKFTYTQRIDFLFHKLSDATCKNCEGKMQLLLDA